MDIPVAVWYLTLAAGIGVSLGALWRLDRPDGRWGLLARKRLVMGVPWGTLVAVLGVSAFYLLAQDGLANPQDPLVLPFRAWGYLYPTGMVTAGFAHAGLGHITGNLLGTLVFGSLAEYAWSHFPKERGVTSFSSLRTDPIARIAAWVLGVFVVGVLSGLFALGPVVGFSGVVFAFIGFALVRFPLATVAATLLADVVSLVYNAIRFPTITRTASESFSRPWWADVAIQGHAFGLFVGIVLAAWLLYRRDVRPKATHVWLAALVIAADRGLWAIYAIESSATYTLYQALGAALVFLVAALVASSVTATPRDLIASIDLSRQEAAYGLLLATVFALALVAVPFNLVVVDDPNAGLEGADPVEVGDYTVFYAEDIENQYISGVPIPAGNTTNVNASGVIVVSEQRNIWWEQISKNRLASRSEAAIRVGGLTWHENVRVTRTTWSLAGGKSTYNVRLGVEDEARPVVFRDERASADARIDGRNISIAPAGDGFDVIVTRNNKTIGRAAVPENGTNITVGGITFERDERNLFAEREDTRVRVARRSR
ncbi:rhomboid family intramembrane serine protease [Natronomonas sp.]|uniref:rhomboid family intramembrane serine protease n=1 Tax=Natronomonas sp. TaxID=2184060 RepID=UPI002FC36D59